MTNNIVPNSFQYPNFLVDKLDYYLSPTETKVLLKAVREILGWNDKIPLRKNPISLSVFVTGKPTKGVMGCGLGIGAVREALESLDKFHILVKVGEPTQAGQMYWLQDDDTKIDWAGLEDRRAKWDAVSKKRTQEATIKSLEKRGITSDVTPTSDATLTSDVIRCNVGRNQGVTSDVNKETHDETHLETLIPANGILPPAIDGQQRAVDKANGAKGPDPVEEVAKHLRWLCAGPGTTVPRGKEGAKYFKAARSLLENVQGDKWLPDDWRKLCQAIDEWSENPPPDDVWWRDKTKEPSFPIDHLAAYYLNPNHNGNGKDKPHAQNPNTRRVHGRIPAYSVADLASFRDQPPDHDTG